MRKRLHVIFLLSSIAGSAFAQDTLKPVKLVTLSEGETSLSRQFFGQVAAKQSVDLAFQVGGLIESIPAVEGNALSQGTLVAQLDLESFELALRQARLQREQAKRTVERLEKLIGSSVSQVAVDDAVTAEALADIAVSNAKIALDHATLLAPFDALVAVRHVANFTTITPGTPVVRLHDMSEIHVKIDVPEILVQRSGRAKDVNITAKFPTQDQIFSLEVVEISADTSPIGQTYRVTLGMTPPEDLFVLPGSSVTVTTNLAGESSGLTAPTSAIRIAEDGQTSVFRFVENEGDTGVLEEIPVSISPTDDGFVNIADGLDAGSEIVVAGVTNLSDGQAVRRFAGFGN